MTVNYLFRCLIIILACFLAITVAREAIVGGHTVYGDMFAHQVSLQIHGHGHVCGGGIISDYHVLTAAHCLLNNTRHLRSSHIYILAGTNMLYITDPPAVNLRVERVFFPKEFHPTVEFSHGDIAVLKLAGSLQLQHNSYLEKLNFRQNHDQSSGEVIVGFGVYEYHHGIGRSDGYLRLAKMSVLSNEDCERAFPHEAIDSIVHFCAKSRQLNLPQNARQSGVCTGDDGGLLVGFDSRTVIGILSRIPHDCDGREQPAVFVHVANYLRMIVSVVHYGSDRQMISLDT